MTPQPDSFILPIFTIHPFPLAFCMPECYFIPYNIWEDTLMEYWDIYDANRNPTGRLHRRGDPRIPGEYGLVVCVWVYDGSGRVLMTKRAPEKSFPLTWENSGGAAQAGETSLQAIRRELYEETGIQAEESEFVLLESIREDYDFFDFYCIRRNTPLEQIILLPGETVDAKWVTLEEVYAMIDRKEICRPIARQFLRQAPLLKQKQSAQC